MAYADHADFFFLSTKQLTHSFCLCLDGTCRSLLDEDVAILPMLKSKKDQIHRFIERHDKTCHGRLCQCDRIPIPNLVNPERDDGATGAHDVSVTGAADFRLSAVAALGHCHLLLNRLSDAHGINRISGLVGRKTDN